MRVVGNAVSTTELGSIPPSSGWINTTSLECSGFSGKGEHTYPQGLL